MKRLHFVVSVLLVIVFLASGCAAPKRAIYNNAVLNGNIKNEFIFRSAATQVFGLRVKFQDMPQLRHDYHLLKPGDSKSFTDTGDWDGDFWLIKWDPVANSPIGKEMKVDGFSLPSFFDDEIIITDLMLSGGSIQTGRVKNLLGFAIDVNLQGQEFVLASGEIKVVQAVSLFPHGAVDVAWRPADALPGEAWKNYKHPIDHNPKGNMVWVDGHPVEVGWTLDIFGSHRSWRRRH